MNNSKNKIKHEIQNDGRESWESSNGIFHQDNDLPAIISPHGIEIYCKEGKYYRKFGPTIKHPDGYEQWSTSKEYDL